MSILEIGEGVVEVRATNGDTHFGGDDWDQHVVQWIVDELKFECMGHDLFIGVSVDIYTAALGGEV